VTPPERRLVATLATAETASWGVLYYTFGVLLRPIQADTGWSPAAIAGAFSTALLASAVAAPVVGRIVDRHGARALMTVGGALGAVLFALAARTRSLSSLYVVWAGLGVVMAAVLYEPAFAVITRRFAGDERRRALTTVTLVAGLASTIFVPLTAVLVSAYGWRLAVLILAAVLGLVTVPLHASLPGAPTAGETSGRSPRAALRTPEFRALTVAFVLGSVTSAAMGAHGVSLLLDRGLGARTAAAAIGALGIAQVAARLLFAPLGARVPAAWIAPAVFLVQAAGVAALLAPGAAAVGAFVVLFGAGNGLVTLVRASVVADLFGSDDYGSVAGALAAPATAARAVGPVAFAAMIGAAGSTLALVGMAVALVGAAAVLHGGLCAPLPRAAPLTRHPRGA
jgi:predicted MFS family arabinose efflux permease